TAADLIIRTIRKKPDLRIGLPTGSTPLCMYDELVKAYRDQRIDFSQLRTFNLDEFIGLAENHPKGYHAYMRHHLFDHVNVLHENIHIPDGKAGVDPDAESNRYENAIQQAGGMDLLIVGIGSNGHIAFNEPGSAFDSRTRTVGLAPETVA